MVLAMLPRAGPHCWYCAWRPVLAIVTLEPAGGFLDEATEAWDPGCCMLEGSKDGYW